MNGLLDALTALFLGLGILCELVYLIRAR